MVVTRETFVIVGVAALCLLYGYLILRGYVRRKRAREAIQRRQPARPS